MATDDLIARLLDATDDPAGASLVDALHNLLDDSGIEAGARPKTIAEAAALTGLSSHTLRYYEDVGLVRPPRNGSGHRAYDAAALRRLVFITRMRAAGMTIRDLRRYVGLVEHGPATEPERRAMMLAQHARIQRQLRALTLALEATEYKIRAYGGHPGG
jgi:DNA-binding transcriptional MerR regulator